MADLTVPQTLLDRLAALERELRAMKRSPQLQQSSLTGGKITALNTAGDRVAEYGELVGGGYGVAVNEASSLSSLLIVSDATGWSAPALGHGWRDASAFKPVTSATFEPVYRASIRYPVSSVLLVDVVTVQDAGTTGELRLRIEGGPTTTVKTLPAGTQTTTLFRWEHGRQLGTLGLQLLLVLEARRTGGTGDVNVYEPDDVFESSLFTAATGGLES